MVAFTPPYSVVWSLTAPDIQMVVVPATSTSATTEIAKVSFTVPPYGMLQQRNELAGWKLQEGGKDYVRLGLTRFFRCVTGA
ncbi:hypothetical protein C8K18_103392 [Paraburkholderia sp. GV068]|nr:hypothetical protein AC233_02475 [Burkholderia sp. HB1]PTR02645.1 hypothetical protein C8K19_103392 [Paraburkholderia sp. GV072]PUB07122.1 hypothetical protein C8K18_103392 [Paraburkholderia sp. GV068]CAB3673702.1 hypothetical protein R8871_02157 [Paraburkholderia graminis C4D1M]